MEEKCPCLLLSRIIFVYNFVRLSLISYAFQTYFLFNVILCQSEIKSINAIKICSFSIFSHFFHFLLSISQTLISQYFVSQIVSSLNPFLPGETKGPYILKKTCILKLQVCLRMFDLLLPLGMERLR